MKLATTILAVLSVITTICCLNHSHSKYHFRPESSPVLWNDKIPALYTFNETQLGHGSWWSSSFITGTNGKQYLALAHVLNVNNMTYYRGSTLDLQTNDYQHFVTRGTKTASGPTLNIIIGKNRFESLSDDNISRLRAVTNTKDVKFDLSWNSSSLILANGGTGAFLFGPVISHEWGMPSSRTKGTITVNNKTITVDPAKSSTWYDRQWEDAGGSITGNWTWFQLHVPGSDYKFSVWAVDNPATEQVSRFATVRDGNGTQLVFPVVWKPDYGRRYVSASSCRVYPLDWTVKIVDLASFHVKSVRADQEIIGENGLETAYEGFTTFKGVLDGHHVTGYGLVEMVYVS
ncbi:Kievitone hydratase [Aspergillus multicolor]|uniref:Kievitone hydratase n=1 Tax=Aspergillus multicolor TaxID=41759 RepID=UPI003CCE30DA